MNKAPRSTSTHPHAEGAGGNARHQEQMSEDEHSPKLPSDRRATDEELIDEALDETFPASDPISPDVAEKMEKRRQGG